MKSACIIHDRVNIAVLPILCMTSILGIADVISCQVRLPCRFRSRCSLHTPPLLTLAELHLPWRAQSRPPSAACPHCLLVLQIFLKLLLSYVIIDTIWIALQPSALPSCATAILARSVPPCDASNACSSNHIRTGGLAAMLLPPRSMSTAAVAA